MEKTFPLRVVETKIQCIFQDKALLFLAFIHRSFWNEHQATVPGHNERLEFLGDSVLGLLVANYLFITYPHLDEGYLSTIRSQLVDAPACIAYVQRLEIAPFLLLGKGERFNQGKGRESILANLFEALIGAIYLDQGIEGARQFFLSHFRYEIDQMVVSPHRNWKAELQDYVQRKYQQAPYYEVVEESGPPHKKKFHILVWIEKEKWGEGEGFSKKEGQMGAAKQAILRLEREGSL